MKLEEIGFYTLYDKRARNLSAVSPMKRCEILITGACNFRCGYCRGPVGTGPGHVKAESVQRALALWADDGLESVRFSGGEPTLHPQLVDFVKLAKALGIKNVAISTNGSSEPSLYESLVQSGANDFSVSLDACCAADGNIMAGTDSKFDKIVNNIALLSKKVYVTVGVVLTEHNANKLLAIIEFASQLGVADIRIIPAAQWNRLLDKDLYVPQELLDRHPILRYRFNNIKNGRHVRGLCSKDSTRCYLPVDDSVIAGEHHYPCVIYMRERGKPIGKVGPNMRAERIQWSRTAAVHKDPICSTQCLDFCIEFNNKCREAEADVDKT